MEPSRRRRSPVRPFAASPEREVREAYRLLHRPMNSRLLDRRNFLQGLLAAGGLAALGGTSLIGRAEAGAPLGADERVLIVLFQSGGNDGLNTLIPHDDGRYFDRRGSLAVSPSGTHPVGDGLYLHPNLSRLKSRFDNGKVAIVKGVGEASDDRSHFVSTARWMAGTAAPAPWYTGWLGRYLDARGSDELAGVAIGERGVPLQLQRAAGDTIALPSWTSGLFGSDYAENNSNRALYDAMLGIDGATMGLGGRAAQIADTTAGAIRTAEELGPIFAPEIEEDDSIMRDAMLATRLINLDVGARVLTLSMGGYDHHADQRPEHDDFMASLDRAIDHIFDNLEPRLRDRVVLLTTSEFGRRVDENGGGTDHGTANCLFAVGNSVRGGHYGEQPSIRNLDDRGDLKHKVDFRSVYATVLEEWLGADSREILGAGYETLGFLSHSCQGEQATIVGTGASETLHGTSGRDVIVGAGGNDLIYGHGGNDLVCAGGGDDTVYGGEGDDVVYGAGGHDDLRGEGGDDVLRGGGGRDQLHGGRGGDILRGNKGSDQLFGKRSEDTFFSGPSDTVLRGQ